MSLCSYWTDCRGSSHDILILYNRLNICEYTRMDTSQYFTSFSSAAAEINFADVSDDFLFLILVAISAVCTHW